MKLQPKKRVGRPEVETPLLTTTFKANVGDLKKAIEIHGSKKVWQKVRDLIHRLSKSK